MAMYTQPFIAWPAHGVPFQFAYKYSIAAGNWDLCDERIALHALTLIWNAYACKGFGRRQLYAIRRRRALAQLGQQAAVLVKAMKARSDVLDSPSRSDAHLERARLQVLSSSPIMRDAPCPCATGSASLGDGYS
ncbi:hypothetical protein BJ912DRAFT_1065032 [Pholiota molesta]|nr:hypothetical protein BJ912DRAFT_1065032 [Pholiota molesta]